jgi:hypothetical protein
MKPTHPELLDFLAGELIRGDWQLKRLHRLVVLSATYRQSSAIADCGFRIADSAAHNPQSAIANPQLEDPDNTLLWRQNLRRLEAEGLRDSILAVSGELNLEMGGRGIFPTLPPEVLAKQSRPGNGWDKSPADQQARRSAYIFVKRTLGVPLLETFDVASPDTPIAERSVTTVAPQALVLLNSDFLEQQAAALADRITRRVGVPPARQPNDPGDDRGAPQITAAYRLTLSRDPTEREAQIAQEFFDREQQRSGDNRQALRELCKLILNLNEFVYVD